MEHRWSKRNPVYLDAFVFHLLSGLMPANILDISLEGAFIGVEHPALPTQAIVELSFALEIDGKQTIQQMEAFVIHRSRNGYGLMFKDFLRGAFKPWPARPMPRSRHCAGAYGTRNTVRCA